MKTRPARPAPTEARNQRTRGLDRMATSALLRVLNREDARVAGAVRREIPSIAKAVEEIVRRLRRGGRLLYVGAGTSGRLATLDAAECPPTFGISPQLVRAIIAGGRRALTSAAEGAEDSAAQGKRDLRAAGVTPKDAVVGLSASGTTLYVLGALEYARSLGAATIGVTANDGAAISRVARILIAPKTGAEAVTGSTRLKAGTAQKLVLNMLSTATMIRLGRVYDNWMIGVALTNQKLRRRGLQILEQATGASPSRAEHAARQAGHDLRVALLMLKRSCSAAEARRQLARAGSDLRQALGERQKRAGR
jgi:N-acetylmuramic acid 6-phosphate etherase